MRAPVGLTAVLLLSCQAGAQTPEFEVASVKWQEPATPTTAEEFRGSMPVYQGGPGTRDPGRIHYANVSLMNLLTKAYGLYADQVIGPEWLTREKYSVEAVLDPKTTQKQFQQMMQKLVEQRFQPVVRWEEREFTIYELTVAKGGPRLMRASGAEASDAEDAVFVPPALKLDADGCPILEPNTHAAVGHVGGSNCTTFRSYTVSELLSRLEMMVAFETGTYFGPQASQAHIVDKTGLEGRFDFHLKYSVASWVRARTGGDEAGGASIFKELEKQLGLRLEKTKARLAVIRIDQIRKVPVGN